MCDAPALLAAAHTRIVVRLGAQRGRAAAAGRRCSACALRGSVARAAAGACSALAAIVAAADGSSGRGVGAG
jgi:hypothetical protein